MSDEHDLGDLIDMQIRTAGPMSVATYMGLCLTHPKRGYYASGDPIGLAGDFITAPEISQMFGELVGFWCVNVWQQLGEPKSFTLLELGPGRGTLMADLLRAAARAPGFLDALHLQLFESNPDLRFQQEQRLSQFHPYWAEEIGALSEDPLIVVANEFFDALPIRQFVRRDDGWHERQVGLRDGKRAFGLSPLPMPGIDVKAEPGEIYEAGIAATDTMAQLSRIVARQTGAILVIDYGYTAPQNGDTLQAVRNHTFADALETPGETDLSVHVNFAALAETASAASLTAHTTTQREFLTRLGIGERAAALARANPGEMATIGAALRRLTAPDQMGELFKVLSATSAGVEPAGFA